MAAARTAVLDVAGKCLRRERLGRCTVAMRCNNCVMRQASFSPN
jgi:hypothetical protein